MTARWPEQGATATVERGVGRSFTWTLAGNICASASQWAAIVILTRLGDKAAVGRFALALAIAAPIAALTNLQLRSVQATDTWGAPLFGHYVALRLAGTAAFVVALLLVALISKADGATLAALAGVATMKSAESFSDIIYGRLQAQERMDRIAQSQILKAVSALTLMLAVIALTGSCEAGIAAFAIALGIVFVTFDRSSLADAARPARWAAVWNGEEIARLLRLSLPLAFALLLVSINASVPRYALQWYRGTEDVGVFAALAYAALPANLIAMTMGQALAPRMAKARASGIRRFRLLAGGLFGIAAVTGATGIAVAVLAGERLLGVLYGAEYAREHRLFVVLMCAGLASTLATAAGCSLTSARYFRVQVPMQLVACATTAIFCAWQVPARGMAGAALAQAGGYAVQLVCSVGYLIFALRRESPVTQRGSM